MQAILPCVSISFTGRWEKRVRIIRTCCILHGKAHIGFSPNILNNSGVVVGTDHNVPVYSVNGSEDLRLAPSTATNTMAVAA